MKDERLVYQAFRDEYGRPFNTWNCDNKVKKTLLKQYDGYLERLYLHEDGSDDDVNEYRTYIVEQLLVDLREQID